jgi:hypothetical protein
LAPEGGGEGGGGHKHNARIFGSVFSCPCTEQYQMTAEAARLKIEDSEAQRLTIEEVENLMI